MLRSLALWVSSTRFAREVLALLTFWSDVGWGICDYTATRLRLVVLQRGSRRSRRNSIGLAR